MFRHVTLRISLFANDAAITRRLAMAHGSLLDNLRARWAHHQSQENNAKGKEHGHCTPSSLLNVSQGHVGKTRGQTTTAGTHKRPRLQIPSGGDSYLRFRILNSVLPTRKTPELFTHTLFEIHSGLDIVMNRIAKKGLGCLFAFPLQGDGRMPKASQLLWRMGFRKGTSWKAYVTPQRHS